MKILNYFIRFCGKITGGLMGKKSRIVADIYKDDQLQSNDQRIVIFVSTEMLKEIEKWGIKHNTKQRSKSIRFMLRCCLHHYDGCDNPDMG